MLVPLDEPEVPELEPVCPEELDVEPLCPDDPDEEEGELGLCEDGELLGELLGEGRLGEGMLGEGMLVLGEVGGGELLLEEQPASARAAPNRSAGMTRRSFSLMVSPVIGLVILSAPCAGPLGPDSVPDARH